MLMWTSTFLWNEIHRIQSQPVFVDHLNWSIPSTIYSHFFEQTRSLFQSFFFFFFSCSLLEMKWMCVLSAFIFGFLCFPLWHNVQCTYINFIKQNNGKRKEIKNTLNKINSLYSFSSFPFLFLCYLLFLRFFFPIFVHSPSFSFSVSMSFHLFFIFFHNRIDVCWFLHSFCLVTSNRSTLLFLMLFLPSHLLVFCFFFVIRTLFFMFALFLKMFFFSFTKIIPFLW